MERLAAGLSIRACYLTERYADKGEGYTFIVKGTGSEMNFMGKVSGEDSGYKPLTLTDGQGDAYAPPFRIFPTAAGKQTDIEIDFRYAEVRTFVTVLPWGKVEQETEM